MPKIVFVIPPVENSYLWNVKTHRPRMQMPSLGVAYLAAMTKKEGFETYILESQILRLSKKEVLKRIVELKPEYVAFTAVTMTIDSAADIASELKRINQFTTIIGGVHVSMIPEESMSSYPQFDISVIGEGEITLIELLRTLENKDDLDKVKGIIYRKEGILKRTNPRPFIQNLDILPFPAWELLPDSRLYRLPIFNGRLKLPNTLLVTTRGCSFNCTFCCVKTFWKHQVRMHSTEYIMELIRILYYKYRVRGIEFEDSGLGIDKNRLIKLCNLLIKEGLKLQWSCNMRVDMVELKLLHLMRGAGCVMIGYGIETSSQDTLDLFNKQVKVDKIFTVLKWTKKAGIITRGYVIAGSLNETKESLEATLDFLLKADLDILMLFQLTVYPGTIDSKRVAQYGKIITTDWRFYTQNNIVFVPNGMVKEELEYYNSLIFRRFHLRPKIIIRQLLFPFSLGHLPDLWGATLRFFKVAILPSILLPIKRFPKNVAYFK